MQTFARGGVVARTEGDRGASAHPRRKQSLSGPIAVVLLATLLTFGQACGSRSAESEPATTDTRPSTTAQAASPRDTLEPTTTDEPTPTEPATTSLPAVSTTVVALDDPAMEAWREQVLATAAVSPRALYDSIVDGGFINADEATAIGANAAALLAAIELVGPPPFFQDGYDEIREDLRQIVDLGARGGACAEIANPSTDEFLECLRAQTELGRAWISIAFSFPSVGLQVVDMDI